MKKINTLILSILPLMFLCVFTACKKDKPTVKEAIATAIEENIIGNEGDVFTVSEGTLREVLDLSQMSTVEYTYNSIVKIKEGDDLKYSICYNGTISAGIDFSKIDIAVDDEKKAIHITVPDAEIISVNVDIGSLGYIFEDDKYETETIVKEAYPLACSDLEKKASENKDILNSAKENAISAVEALLNPWIEQIGEYTTEVK